MFTLQQSLYIRGSAGDPLPKVWSTLDADFLRGQLALVSAAPGIGKSAFVLSYGLRSRVPMLYLSADSDAFTQTSRSISILTGCPMDESKRQVRTQKLEPRAVAALDSLPVQFKYDASPTLTQIEHPLEAFGQKYGEYPALVVIDNLTNVRLGAGPNEDDPFAGLEGLMDYMHEMARKTAACVIVLHHVQGAYNNGNIPIPLGGIKGQIGRVPEMVLTLHRVRNEYGPDAMNVSIVKDRNGKPDPSGYTYTTLEFDGDTMQIKDAA